MLNVICNFDLWLICKEKHLLVVTKIIVWYDDIFIKKKKKKNVGEIKRKFPRYRTFKPLTYNRVRLGL